MTFTKDGIPWNKGLVGEKSHSFGNKHRLGMSPWNKGVKLTDEQKKKISESRKGIEPWNKGKKWSEDVIQKIKKTISQKKEVVKNV